MSPLFKLLLPLCLPLILTACASAKYVLISKENFTASQQCLLQQQQQQQQLIEQQQQFTQSLDKFNQLLEKPLQVKGTVVKLSDAALCPASDVPQADEKLKEQAQNHKQIVGAIEDVALPELGLTLLGRIDTGATTASIDAQDVQVFERDGERWVKFKVLRQDTGQTQEFERKLVRRVLINQSTAEAPERRPVIELQVTIGNVSQRAEFTLANRGHLDYQVLIGRNVLRDVMVVDVSKEHLAPLVQQP